MTEKQLTDAVMDTTAIYGWYAIHMRPAKTDAGWRTPVQGRHAKGFPDLLAIRGSRILFAEFKVKGKKPTAEQWGWLRVVEEAGAEAYFWNEHDWLNGEIEAVLR